jgi:hypothetical protein
MPNTSWFMNEARSAKVNRRKKLIREALERAGVNTPHKRGALLRRMNATGSSLRATHAVLSEWVAEEAKKQAKAEAKRQAALDCPF